MRFGVVILFFFGFLAFANAQENPSSKQTVSPSIGLEVGDKAPAFTLRDQFDHGQSNETLRGSNGTVLLFFRSADWWPFCKAQLVQLQNARERFESQGIKLAAISYDSPEILKDFANRHKIGFSLLADPRSKIIRSFNVLNAEATGIEKGMAHPGFFYIDKSSVIREKYFEAKYTDRFTPNNVIGKLLPELAEEVGQHLEAPHLRLTLAQSDRTAVPGSRVSLIAEVELPPDVHVYSPEVKGYKPIQLALQASPKIELTSLTYPNSKVLYLEAIQEHVPVFEGKFRITQDVTVTPSRTRDIIRSVVSAGRTISITGELKYQACDKTVCYPPTSVPVMWRLQVLPLDLKRSPEGIRHK
jgi:peroxiredoxin